MKISSDIFQCVKVEISNAGIPEHLKIVLTGEDGHTHSTTIYSGHTEGETWPAILLTIARNPSTEPSDA